ncbi:MAG: TerC family protein [Sandaracinaceae bacterium]
MAELLTLQNLGDLVMLLFLQAVLGFDNLLYISIESGRAPEPQQGWVRRTGILIALALRIVLLAAVIFILDYVEATLFGIHWTGYIEGDFTISTVVFLFGGAFILWTAVREIRHLLELEEVGHEEREPKAAWSVVALIVLMNLIFSFDSILSAIAITRVLPVLIVAIVVSGILMLVLADEVAEFIHKNRKYEVLGLFILLIVGVVLIGEGGHEAHLRLLDVAVEPISKSTFYFSVVVLVVVDVLQSGYQRRLALERERQAQRKAS